MLAKDAYAIFCLILKLYKHPEPVQKYLGSVVPVADNCFAALNAAVFSDGLLCAHLKHQMPNGTIHLLGFH